MNSSEEYIIRLLQTIESLESTMKSIREEIMFLRDELARLRENDAAHDLEWKRLTAMIEAKDQDIRKLTYKTSDLLGKVDALTKALEDKTHQLTNRGQFDTKINHRNINNLFYLIIYNWITACILGFSCSERS